MHTSHVSNSGFRPGPRADYRRILDRREIDGVLIGTPDHWHKTITLDAVAAGKDVYVEKPVSHRIEEGVELVKAIEASKHVVQTGTQQRSWEHWILAKQIIDSGKLGQITFVHTYWYQHTRAGTYAPVALDNSIGNSGWDRRPISRSAPSASTSGATSGISAAAASPI